MAEENAQPLRTAASLASMFDPLAHTLVGSRKDSVTEILPSATNVGVRMKGLTPAETAELKEIFGLVDKDGGGTISKSELAELMLTLGIRASGEELDIMMKEVDIDGSGEIDFAEFVQVMQRRVSVPYTSADLKAAFKVFENGCPSGYVKVQDLITALLTYGAGISEDEKLTEDRVAELVSQMEPDSSGLVNYVDFVSMMLDS
jgi:calmodulin